MQTWVNQQDNEEAGKIHLYQADIQIPKDFGDEDGLYFSIKTPSRAYWIQAESKQERTKWVDLITQCIVDLESINPYDHTVK